MAKQFKLFIGIHYSTYTSRDVLKPQYFRTYPEALDAYEKSTKSLRDSGSNIWFARISLPDGTATVLEKDNSY